MKKADEIKLLEQLRKEDTYFKAAFGEEAITKMISNINNDFDLFTGVQTEYERSLEKRVEELAEKVEGKDVLLQARNEQLTHHRRILLEILIKAKEEAAGQPAPTIDNVISGYTTLEIIKAKRLVGVALELSEIDYLISNQQA